jgi:hypothetical protein
VYPYSPADEYVLPDFGAKCAEKRDTHVTKTPRAQGHEGKLDALPESPPQEIDQPVILLVGGKINLRAVYGLHRAELVIKQRSCVPMLLWRLKVFQVISHTFLGAD